MASTAGIGVPFFLNGIPSFATNRSKFVGSNASDRVIVIVHLAGANDGLNTIIPVSQYTNYANLRPNIRIQQTGLNKYIDLDTTLPADKLSGLHPVMTGFKSLYDSGKLAIIPGVGYPAPNYSHFIGETIMFAGKDGNTSNSLPNGMFGRYLTKVLPGTASNPSTLMPDPLAVHLGNANSNFFYEHSPDVGVEYNATIYESNLFTTGNFRVSALPSSSEYTDTLAYIRTIEKSMDIYLNRLESTFAAGTNSATAYPNTYLAKQLKTVARLLKGGSKSKIFHVTLSGFDTHIKQVVAGATHTGNHANLLLELSGALNAFQTDLGLLGLDERVMTATFSEFGRQLHDNGASSLGTDHGDISPFFVIGKNVKPGVVNSHPNISASSINGGYYYPESERKVDYRQIFATLLQNWLGADDSVMTATELQTFSTPTQKLDIILTSKIATPTSSLIDCSVSPKDTVIATKVYEELGWSYYASKDYTGNQFLFGIEHKPAIAGGNTNEFSATITLEKLICNPDSNTVQSVRNQVAGEGTFVSGYFWNIALSGTTNGTVNIRFFQNDTYLSDLQTFATNFKTASGANYISPPIWFKTKDAALVLPNGLRPDGSGFQASIKSLKLSTPGAMNSFGYTQFNDVADLDKTGGGCMIKVTKFTQANMSQSSSGTPLIGTLRFNSELKQFEGYNGTTWVKLGL